MTENSGGKKWNWRGGDAAQWQCGAHAEPLHTFARAQAN